MIVIRTRRTKKKSKQALEISKKNQIMPLNMLIGLKKRQEAQERGTSSLEEQIYCFYKGTEEPYKYKKNQSQRWKQIKMINDQTKKYLFSLLQQKPCYTYIDKKRNTKVTVKS